ncbi:RNA-directed DNA polymerase [Planococcus ruber]|uniref:RNA-directed DNA polymerase n=1 Tax=Planococcus ruber TaxID=2027871 RepID=UPI001FEF4ED9|nr:RNA-directed DNA polymerase [Planococcus ruber]MCJ1909212.1 RNA-directed DNA polymerase [Planococcus ruber]
MKFKLNTIRTNKRTFHLVNEPFKKSFNEVMTEIRNKYAIKMPNRDLIIKSIISTLVHGDFKYYSMPRMNISVTRSDIKNFYPTIDKHRLYRKINSSNVLSQESMVILKQILLNNKYKGVPLGLPFSNHLAEFYVEYIDNKIQMEINPIVYFRYVDDIICIKYCDFLEVEDRSIYANGIKRSIKEILKSQKLSINKLKTKTSYYLYDSKQINKNSDLNFTYLGYNFTTLQEKLVIKISDVKLKKYEKRLNILLYDFRKGKRRNIDFWRLYYKLLNELYGITTVSKMNNKMKSGLAYHYRFINNYDNLFHFIKKYKGIILSLGLNSAKTHLLLNLFSDNKEEIFMKKRYDYLKLTKTQQQKIGNRLQFNPEGLDSKEFARKIFKILYQKT